MAVVAGALPAKQGYTVEMSYAGKGDAAWQAAVKLAALAVCIQELTATKVPPGVVLRPVDDPKKVGITVKVGSEQDSEVMCSGSDIESVRAQLNRKVTKHTVLTFTTNQDRPGLLAEVSKLLKSHGANILKAETQTDETSQQAVHVYNVVDVATGARLNDAALARLEADLAVLWDACPKVRDLLKSGATPNVSTESAATLATDASAGKKKFAIVISCKATDSLWKVATELGALRARVRDVTGSEDLPAVVMKTAGAAEVECVQVVAQCEGSSGWDVISECASANAAEAEFVAKFEKYSIVTFRSECDRPGLLAEVTELLKMHGANIVHAVVTTDAAAGSATHIYKVSDSKTGQRLNDEVLSQLEKDFKVIRDAAPSVRRLLLESDQ
mmetsp:Transcript_101343/g.285833  ORF Transcript_101343/g.285833 Transcript_101343/m.285833 type:complete len:386 (-) Transcript_101343:114-1271(-)|eukprot:CAMPEP_0117559236 /NCGR_PEP_ID=MMETSP0784-20121206/53254_1 /TAXON_ID=39447 /ORGANISM="" /LENGTH=385 /DNA_ID=CAMNT_0005356603 /DNA_START=61 /DNA_END=1218 /DNA_ORIENTATION=-